MKRVGGILFGIAALIGFGWVTVRTIDQTLWEDLAFVAQDRMIRERQEWQREMAAFDSHSTTETPTTPRWDSN